MGTWANAQFGLPFVVYDPRGGDRCVYNELRKGLLLGKRGKGGSGARINEWKMSIEEQGTKGAYGDERAAASRKSGAWKIRSHRTMPNYENLVQVEGPCSR